MRAQHSRTTRITCSTMTIAVPGCATDRLISAISSVISLSTSPAPTSSSSTMRGFSASARATSSRLRRSSGRARAGSRGDVGKAGASQQRRALVARLRRSDERRDRILRDLQIFLDRHVEERARDLIGAADAGAGALRRRQPRHVAAVEPDRPLARRHARRRSGRSASTFPRHSGR